MALGKTNSRTHYRVWWPGDWYAQGLSDGSSVALHLGTIAALCDRYGYRRSKRPVTLLRRLYVSKNGKRSRQTVQIVCVERFVCLKLSNGATGLYVLPEFGQAPAGQHSKHDRRDKSKYVRG